MNPSLTVFCSHTNLASSRELHVYDFVFQNLLFGEHARTERNAKRRFKKEVQKARPFGLLFALARTRYYNI